MVRLIEIVNRSSSNRLWCRAVTQCPADQAGGLAHCLNSLVVGSGALMLDYNPAYRSMITAVMLIAPRFAII
jgi:hypothetical protein